ncbi:glycosyltransferase [Agromyces sp. PvR057]|uniref:glycosyltransferase n=1 Tax=Agromyces sp. PvR057 TaxID=3156403 RepID=UPI0033941B8F
MTRIIHATETLSSGVLTSLVELTSSQIEMGADVTLVHARRADTPSTDQLDRIFPDQLKRVEIAQGGLVTVLTTMGRSLQDLVRGEPATIVHLHSTYAGVAGRLPRLGRSVGNHGRLFYSPHGYSFLREDHSKLARLAMLVVERVLARRGTSVLVSDSEAALARKNLRVQHPTVLINAVDTVRLGNIADMASRSTHALPRVAMVGRVSYQKAPWRFADLARQLSDRAEFTWFGDGDPDDLRHWLGNSPVKVTGWLDRDVLLQELAATDLVVFPTLWEGMPLALIESHALGVPAVASNIVGNRDVVVDGVTGVLVVDDVQLVRATVELLSNPHLRSNMGRAARTRAEANFSRARLRRECLRIYQ